ncbi:hypothetical protein HORIV_12320 [Vreelandella olivaria]|uniref:Uncharacterized protein n=1 Tax=Vreelandella olivaria TaxID=390919 RepID=A0ABM7GE59_9GAMM|nr:hypothetical protein HORIV_12320 [Halomonas olivaria]
MMHADERFPATQAMPDEYGLGRNTRRQIADQGLGNDMRRLGHVYKIQRLIQCQSKDHIA